MNKNIFLIILGLILISGCSYNQQPTTSIVAINEPLDVNVTNNAIVTQTYAHHEIHEGDHYYIDDKFTLGNGATRNILFITPACNLTKYVHLVAGANSNGIITSFALFEGSTYSSVGTIEPIHNRNRVLNFISLSSVYTTPTILTTGTIIRDEHWGIKEKLGGDNRGSEEILLNCGTNYLIRITSGETLNLINVKLDWYENGLEN